MRHSRRAVLTSLLPLAAVATPRYMFAEEPVGSPQNGGIVFVGSSIFRFWNHLVEQMAPLPVLNRAIAGTVTQDMLGGIDRLVLTYKPRIVVF